MSTKVIKPVPAPAKVLLNGLSGPESGGDYEAWSSYKQKNLPKPLTQSSIVEVLRYQLDWRHYGGISSAAGRYQIIRKTLRMLVDILGLTGDELFDEAMQDRLGYQLLKIRGYDSWMAGSLSNNAFANNLAKEWASFPVVTRIKNYKGDVINPGTSYYAGDGLNSHGVSVDTVHKLLEAAWTAGDADDVYVPVPKAKPTKIDTAAKVGTGVAAGGTAVVIAPSVIPDMDKIVSTVNTLKPLFELVVNNYGAHGLIALGVGVVAYLGIKYFTKK